MNTIKLIFLALTILMLRIVYLQIYQNLSDSYGYNLSDYIHTILTDYTSLLSLIILCGATVLLLTKFFKYGEYPIKRVSLTLLFIIFISAIVTVIACRSIIFYDINNNINPTPESRSIVFVTYMALIIITGVLILSVDLWIYLLKSKSDLNKADSKSRWVEYRYAQLKGQLNPHFLFNSLNILDYLVNNNQTERASEFINKLAGVYRYLLSKEKVQLVTIQDEITFVTKYVDLLKERFTTGLIVNYSISQEFIIDSTKLIIPCGLQLLIENAVKHNTVNSATPLIIDIYLEDNYLVVKNNINPKINDKSVSTGIGLNNITEQYKELTNDRIVINNSKSNFIVKLPIIED